MSKPLSNAFVLLASILALGCLLNSGPATAVERLYRCDDLAQRAKLTSLNSRMYQGDDGWFFRDSDLNTFYMLSPQTKGFLSRLTDALAFHGITLALLPLPPKSVLEPAHSITATADGDVLFDPGFARAQFFALVSDLKASHLTVADVLATLAAPVPGMEGDFYFARDIHWRPKLAKASADAVAKVLLDASGQTLFGTKKFITRKLTATLNESNTNSILSQLCTEPLPNEMVDIYTTEEAEQSLDSFLVTDDSAPAINVVGTSFTDEAKPFNFSGFLREDLQNDVATYSISGGGVDTALYKWAHDGLAATSGAKALIWEIPFPERLETIAAAIEREIIPAIAGSCAGSSAEVQSVSYALAANGSFTFTLDPAVKASGSNFYIAAALSDPSLRAFALVFDYRDGRQDVLPIIRPDRVAAVANVFGQLTGEVSSELASVTLQNRNGQAASGTIALCQYPAGMWRTSAIVSP